MPDEMPAREYLVLSRGMWDPRRTPEEIQRAIDAFYEWHARLVAEGVMRPGQRLARDGRLVTRNAITDGPFTETKEIVGGYWFVVARSLDEAARIAAENPCLPFGLAYEIRPIETARASAYARTSETPDDASTG